MANYNLYIKFISELIVEGAITLPNLLLKNYTKMELNEKELILLLHIWRFAQEESNDSPSSAQIANYMTIESAEVDILIEGLVARKLLSIEEVYDPTSPQRIGKLSFNGLLDQLMEIWALTKAQKLDENQEKKQVDTEIIQNIFQVFEDELGRLLSPFEANQILEWCNQDKFSSELIIEALRKASLRGVKNLKYIDTILSDWQRNGIFSLEQVAEYEKRFRTNQQIKKSGPKTAPDISEEIQQRIEKYKDVYMS